MRPLPLNKNEEELNHLVSPLKSVGDFLEKTHHLNCVSFDYAIINDMNLFSAQNEINFEEIDNVSKYLQSMEGSIKRIFSKPIIILKDIDEVLPVDEVHYINQASIEHLISHSQNVVSIKHRRVTPRKLLTKISEDDYGIYENLIFVNFVDEAMEYIKENLYKIKNFLAISDSLYFNLLERNNHLEYFLSIGMLETGYVREYNKYSALARKLYARLTSLSVFFNSRLKKPVYALNHKRVVELKLKKTNIFLMQKDYHKIYLGYKYFLGSGIIKETINAPLNRDELANNYFYYCQFLLIFALLHFNFTLPRKTQINFRKLKSVFTFKDWTIKLLNYKNKGFIINIHKDRTYNFLLIPSIKEEINPDDVNIKSHYRGVKKIVLTPFEKIAYEGRSANITTEDIDSFRRFQQLFLEGMIYADKSHDLCPFCGEIMHKNENDSRFECDSCGTIINKTICPKDNQVYYYTDLSFFNPNLVSKEKLPFVSQKKNASQKMFFRNITDFDNEHNHICPICGERHIGRLSK